MTNLTLWGYGLQSPLKRTAQFTLFDLKRNDYRRAEVESFENKIQKYKSNWFNHVSRKENFWIPKSMIYYKLKTRKTSPKTFRRNPKRSIKRSDSSFIMKMSKGMLKNKYQFWYWNFECEDDIGPFIYQTWAKGQNHMKLNYSYNAINFITGLLNSHF